MVGVRTQARPQARPRTKIGAAVRALVGPLSTPLLADDYLKLVNPLWSARELRGRIVAVQVALAERKSVPVEVEAIGTVDGGRIVVARLLDGSHVGVDADSGRIRWSQADMREHAGVAIDTAVPNQLLLARGTLRTVLLVDPGSGAATPLEHSFEYPRVAALAPDRRTIALGTIEANGELALMDATDFHAIDRLPCFDR